MKRMTSILQETILVMVIFVSQGFGHNDQEIKNLILERLAQQDHKIQLQDEKILKQDKEIEQLKIAMQVQETIQMYINDTIDRHDNQIENTITTGKNLKTKIKNSSFLLKVFTKYINFKLFVLRMKPLQFHFLSFQNGNRY